MGKEEEEGVYQIFNRMKMMEDTGISTKPQSLPEHWSQSLRCTICFGYLHEPHTLECGHTFCKRCLKRLAEIAKEDNPNVRVRRLSLSCPTCRHSFPAKPVLGQRVCTNIVLKHLVELWKRECKMLATSSLLTERSICSQTQLSDFEGSTERQSSKEDDVDAKESDSKNDLQEEFTVHFRPLETYCQVIMQRVTEFTQDYSDSLENCSEKTLDPASTTEFNGQSDNISSESESSVAPSEREASQVSSSISDIQMTDIFLPSIPYFRLTECTPGRLLVMVVWCMYSVVIVGLAETFLPYVILFTLFFFLVVLG